MTPKLIDLITQALQANFNSQARITSVTPAARSSFSNTARLTLHNGEALFVKYAANPPGDIFQREYESLRLLHNTRTLAVPEPVCSGREFLVTRWLEFGNKANDWQEKLGQRLALMHRATQNGRYGFDAHNYLGASPQLNSWHDSWLDFWRDCRLGPQLTMWRMRDEGSNQLLQLGDRLLNRLDEYLAGIHEPAVLLHGDLWSGNAAADSNGEPVIFDPASYYGHREAEFGMMRLFGGFGPRVENAYQEIWPFESGSEQRIALYRLYHELNHLNLFGAAYYEQCVSTIKKLL